MPAAVDINQLSESQLRDYAAQLQASLGERDATIQRLTVEKDHLTHEIAILRRHRFGKRSEIKGRSPQQSLLDDLVEEDIAAIETELEKLDEPLIEARQRSKPRRQSLPPQLPRTEIRHDPERGGMVRLGDEMLSQWLPWHFDHCYNNELNRAGVLRAGCRALSAIYEVDVPWASVIESKAGACKGSRHASS